MKKSIEIVAEQKSSENFTVIKMDVIKTTHERAMHMLLTVDVSDLITDPNLKEEMKRFRELDDKNNDLDLPELPNDDTCDIRKQLTFARKRKAEHFQLLDNAINNIKRLKKDCLSSLEEVKTLESKLKIAVTASVSDVPPEIKAIDYEMDSLATSFASNSLVSEKVQLPDSTLTRLVQSSSSLLCTKKHHEPKFECALCSKKYFAKESFDSHVESHTGTTHKCTLCNQPPYTSEKSYKRHMKWHVNGCPKFICQTCSKSFDYKYRLTSHQRTHQEPTLQCRVDSNCTKKYTFENERKNHEAYGHLEQKPIQCATCDKFYTSPALLRIHQKAFKHSGIKEFS